MHFLVTICSGYAELRHKLEDEATCEGYEASKKLGGKPSNHTHLLVVM